MTESTFDIHEFRELFTACIIMHDLPFQCVEWPGLRSLLQYLRHDLQIISRNTARSDCKKMFTKEKCLIQKEILKSNSRVSLTSDLWTSINTDGFICLTAHFIDNNWLLQKKIINFGFMPPPHDGIALCEKLHLFLTEWKIQNRIFSITLDNASANNVYVEFLRNQLNLCGALLYKGEFFHIRCCAHVVNLIVQEGLKEVDISISNVRESIKYVKGSQARKQKFLECVKQSYLDSKKGLRQDVPTRWNSTFIMLDSAIYYKRAFQHLELLDSNFKTCPSNAEWDRIDIICKFLAPFYEITYAFSGTKYPTSNLFFPCVSTAYASLKHERLYGIEYIRNIATTMLVKFEKYWFDFCDILAIVVILDPSTNSHLLNGVIKNYMEVITFLKQRR
ncbi:Putative AC transposase [Dendrobium catenatum]|uniref:AC transposase n=1 Tax=Dendrobium catenatum TaxID=906689 RepID=A0A2I0VV31_9ASPA|nr:Putative AC transposase [Dendrobium catenatum]